MMSILIALLLVLATNNALTCSGAAVKPFAAKHNVSPAVVSGGEMTAIKYTNVGGSGSYQRVTNLISGKGTQCAVPNDFCVRSPVTVSGPLAPFNADLTLVFSGPLNIYNISVYQPSGNSPTADWKRVSRFRAGKANPENLVFMNNLGGTKSGVWDACGGASQSYASGDFAGSVSTANEEIFHGFVPRGLDVNIMTDTPCTPSDCPGFFRGTSNVGWSGSKLFVLQFDMPGGNDNPEKPPAIWALNGEVVRSAQYGCNCRGMGGEHGAGGCGELDILENLKGKPNNGISDFKGASGSGNEDYFPRPLETKVTYGVIFDTATNQIAIQRWKNWKWPNTVSRADIDTYLSAEAKVASLA
ncbi:hypothetical protein QFC21_003751 [Naganishia friedmannii]|uniref:Uncharacterized protein n=1 Tax=Naganishia friedmannii TaxID=89922 RepID=A0ACC2VKZ1_9TREE|nr:hypothetical protein QFC21_003751 [Naganishia friedmannii]